MLQNILITGGSGLLGVNWAAIWRDHFQVVLGCHTRFIKMDRVFSKLIELSSIKKIVSVLKNDSIDLVINTAGYTDINACQKYPHIARNANTIVAANVAEACAIVGIKMVHISTDHLFDGLIPLRDENAEPSPVNVYAETKLAGEIKVLNICPESLVVRTNFFGWGPSYRHSFSDYIIDSLRKKRSISLFSDVFFTPIVIENLVKVVTDLITKNVTGIINVAGDERISKLEFGLKLADQFKLGRNDIEESQIHDRIDLVRRPKDLSLSNDKVCNLLGRSLGSVEQQIHILIRQEHSGLSEELRAL